MKVILTQDIRGKGKRGQMIEVSDGYARNYLLPRKLAQEATAEREAKERAEALEISKKLKDLTVIITAKGGGAGRLFGSVTNTEIADALEQQTGIRVDKRRIIIDEPIKSVGPYTVRCKLGYEITGELKLDVREG